MSEDCSIPKPFTETHATKLANTRRPEPVKHGLTYPEQARRFENRATMAADQRALRIANERALTMARRLDDDNEEVSFSQTFDRAEFLHVFTSVRRRTLAGEDTYALYRAFVQDPDGSVAEAAYIEAIASTRKATRTVYGVMGR